MRQLDQKRQHQTLHDSSHPVYDSTEYQYETGFQVIFFERLQRLMTMGYVISHIGTYTRSFCFHNKFDTTLCNNRRISKVAIAVLISNNNSIGGVADDHTSQRSIQDNGLSYHQLLNIAAKTVRKSINKLNSLLFGTIQFHVKSVVFQRCSVICNNCCCCYCCCRRFFFRWCLCWVLSSGSASSPSSSPSFKKKFITLFFAGAVYYYMINFQLEVCTTSLLSHAPLPLAPHLCPSLLLPSCTVTISYPFFFVDNFSPENQRNITEIQRLLVPIRRYYP